MQTHLTICQLLTCCCTIKIMWSYTSYFLIRRRFIRCCACLRERWCTSFREISGRGRWRGWVKISLFCGFSTEWSRLFRLRVASNRRLFLVGIRIRGCRFWSPLSRTLPHTPQAAACCSAHPPHYKSQLCWNSHNPYFSLFLGRSCSTSALDLRSLHRAIVSA